MKLPRRNFLRLAAGAAALPALSRIALAQAYPTRPVHIIAGFPAGGAGDILARLMAQWLSGRLGQAVVVDNRPGAGGNIATEAVVRAPADGYMLLLAGSSDAINATLYQRLNFTFIHDITPVAGIARTPLVMVVNPSLPAKTVPEFIAYAKANPGRLKMASGGTGSVQHLAGELFKVMTGLDMPHVPYRVSTAALADLVSGQIQVLFAPVPSSIKSIKGEKLRALAVTSSIRQDVLPGIPTVAEFIPGYEASIWVGIGAPSGVRPDIVGGLNQEINAGLADSKIKERLANLGGIAMPLSPDDFGRLIAAETEKWAKVIKFAGVKPD